MPRPSTKWTWARAAGHRETWRPRLDAGARGRSSKNLESRTLPSGVGGDAGSELAEQVEAIERWYVHDWAVLDAKLRTSIVEGISVFLSLFDQPDVAGVFCPPPPEETEDTGPAGEDAPMSSPCRDSGDGCRRSRS